MLPYIYEKIANQDGLPLTQAEHLEKLIETVDVLIEELHEIRALAIRLASCG
jgi:hypothetical protein